jgi:hypothetical protein
MTDFTEKILIGTFTLIIGIVIKHIWDKYINRITKLKYSIWHNYIGSSIEDVKFGSVKLLYNQNELQNLYTSNVIIKNETGKDLNDLELNISCDNQSLILVSHGRNTNSIKELEFTDYYASIIEQNDPANANYIYTRRDYMIPVINRGDSIEITLLTTNFNNQRPVLFVTSEHKGVKLKYYIEPIKLMGVSQLTSTLLGLIISVIICVPIYYFICNKTLIIALTLLNGWIASLYGVMILKINDWIKKLLE